MRQSMTESFFRLARRFRKAESGATVTVFAFSAVVLICLGGAVVDYGRLTKAHTALQAATDSAALAAARLPSKDTAAMRTAANNFFAANTASINGHTIEITNFTFQATTGTVTVETSGVLDTTLMSIAGFRTMGFSAKSAAVKEVTGTVEMALVLDNTWSMSESAGGSDSKITVLKSAAKKLVETVLSEGGTNVRIGIVPFADYVNVGMGNRSEAWLSVPADSTKTEDTSTPRICVEKTTKQVCTRGSPATCTRAGKDGVRETYDCTPQTCTQQTVAPYQSCSGGPSTRTTVNKWFGCVYSRKTGNLRLNDSDPTTPYPGVMGSSQTCLKPIIPLTSDRATLTSAIDGLITNIGNYKPSTYIPAGLIWGVNVLSPTAPFSEGRAYDAANRMPRKALVLMTDGANTMYFRNSDGSHQDKRNNGDVTTANLDTTKLCDYAKSKNIEVYTVAFAVTDVAAKTMLQGCATDAAHYYDATNAAALAAAFQAIGQSLTSLRLSQ